MPADPYRRHRFPPEAIAHAVWLYGRLTLSFRDVEELLATRGVIVSDEAVRLWGTKLGPSFADPLQRLRQPLGRPWFLDEVFVRMGGVQHDLVASGGPARVACRTRGSPCSSDKPDHVAGRVRAGPPFDRRVR